MSLIGGLRAGTGGVRTTGGPVATGGGGGGTDATKTLFDLVTSYGHGVAADQQLPSGESFWLSPTTSGDIATPDQLREWYCDTALGFLALEVVIDSATLPIDIDSPSDAYIVVTVDGAETAVSVHVPPGTSTDLERTALVLFSVAAGSHVGLKWKGDNVQPGASIQLEARLRGAATGTPTIPAVLPGTALAIFESADLSPDGTAWTDSVVGHTYNLAVPVVVGAGAPTVVPAAFKTLRGAHFDGIKQVLSTQNAMFAGGLVPQARTFMAVLKPDSAIGGTAGCFKEAASYFSCTLWKTAGQQFAYENGVANNSQLSAPVDYGGQPIVCIWRSDGVTIELFVDGVLRASATDAVGPEQGIGIGFSMGNNLANFGDRGMLGLIGGEWVWARRFTDSEVIAATSYATAKYLP